MTIGARSLTFTLPPSPLVFSMNEWLELALCVAGVWMIAAALCAPSADRGNR